jgi:hypothetical protein
MDENRRADAIPRARVSREPNGGDRRPDGMPTLRQAARPAVATLLVVPLIIVLVACRQAYSSGASGSPSGTDAGGAMLVQGTVTAGPTCPVERDPPDPSCDDRPVAGAELVIEDRNGSRVAQVASAADGTFSLRLVPGAYRLVPQPRQGMMGTGSPVEFQVAAGIAPPPLQVTYDTGIR